MATRNAINKRRLPFLPDRQIEHEAEVFLAEYRQTHGAVAEPPVPVDEMIELYPDLILKFHGMRKLFGVGDGTRPTCTRNFVVTGHVRERWT